MTSALKDVFHRVGLSPLTLTDEPSMTTSGPNDHIGGSVEENVSSSTRLSVLRISSSTMFAAGSITPSRLRRASAAHDPPAAAPRALLTGRRNTT